MGGETIFQIFIISLTVVIITIVAWLTWRCKDDEKEKNSSELSDIEKRYRDSVRVAENATHAKRCYVCGKDVTLLSHTKEGSKYACVDHSRYSKRHSEPMSQEKIDNLKAIKEGRWEDVKRIDNK